MHTDTEALRTRLALLAAHPATMLAATRDRIGGSRLAHLRGWMHSTDARCVSCGIATRVDVAKSHPLHAELGHLIAASTYAASNVRAGFVPGNIGIMCHTCNADASARDLSFTVDMLNYPELVPMEWPTLRSVKASETSEADWSRNNRKW